MKTPNKVVFVGDLLRNLDDYVSIIFLHRSGNLDYCVLQNVEVNDITISRYERLVSLGVDVRYKIVGGMINIVCGGALRLVRKFIENGGHIYKLVLCGNIRNLESNRFNDNIGWLLSKNTYGTIREIYFIGGNVINPTLTIDGYFKEIYNNYVRDVDDCIAKTYYLESLLASVEALRLINFRRTDLEYTWLNVSSWDFRVIMSAVAWR